MRLSNLSALALVVLSALSFVSCSKTEDFTTEKISDYLPMQTGKYITYRVDSMVFTNFGRDVETHRYQVKHVIDAALTDNLGRPSYRVYTYIRDSAGIQDWATMGSYSVTPLTNQTEVIEDNLRVIKLHAPMKEGFEWNGNTYLPSEPYSDQYDFNNDNDMKEWNFTYETPETTSDYQGHSYADVYSVMQQDDHFNIPVVDVHTFGFKTYSEEKYSKTIGMVYRQYILWEYQPNPSGSSPYNTGFGVTMWMIDHN